MAFSIPSLKEIPAFYHNYILQIKDANPIYLLEKGKQQVVESFSRLSAEQWNYAYAPNKWTLAVLLQHLIDSEQVFAYRALRFSRLDATELPGFDENLWADKSTHLPYISKPESLLKQYQIQREHTLLLFQNMSHEALYFVGRANGNTMTANALAFIIAGHEAHHLQIIEERYF